MPFHDPVRNALCGQLEFVLAFLFQTQRYIGLVDLDRFVVSDFSAGRRNVKRL